MSLSANNVSSWSGEVKRINSYPSSILRHAGRNFMLAISDLNVMFAKI